MCAYSLRYHGTALVAHASVSSEMLFSSLTAFSISSSTFFSQADTSSAIFSHSIRASASLLAGLLRVWT